MKRVVVAAALVLAATSARAESPRWGSLELGAGSYSPNIDSEFTPAPGQLPPYQKVFGSGRGWLFRAAVSRALFTRVGSLEVGFKTGYFQKTAKALDSTGQPSGDETSFKFIPTSVMLTYRADFIADWWNIPLVPYGRASLERYNWWTTSGDGTWDKEGATNGWSVAGGLALLLDFFDPQLARELDMDSGINHTYLFFEVQKSKVNDFGSSSSWDLSDPKLSLTGGLLLTF